LVFCYLQVEFGGDSHEEFHTEIVVESLEGLSSGTTRNHVHHGGFDFQEAQVVQILSDGLDDLSSGVEDVSSFVVHDEIQISLSISSFCVGETSVFSGQHVQAVTEDSD